MRARSIPKGTGSAPLTWHMHRVWLLSVLLLWLPPSGHAQQTAQAAASAAAPAAVDYKALFEQANDAGRKWQLRAQLLEAENFELTAYPNNRFCGRLQGENT